MCKSHQKLNRLFVLNSFLFFPGTVVGPILTGRLLDNTCQVWRQNCRGAPSSCWLYDTDMMSTSAYIGVAVTKVFSIVFCLLALWLYRPPRGPRTLSETAASPEERTELRPVDK